MFAQYSPTLQTDYLTCLANPGADTVVKENDVLFVLGNPDNIAQLKGMMVYACPLGDRPKPGATS